MQKLNERKYTIRFIEIPDVLAIWGAKYTSYFITNADTYFRNME